MDELIKTYAAELQAIYDNRTAGDHSFSGVLAEFLEEIIKTDAAVDTLLRRTMRARQP